MNLADGIHSDTRGARNVAGIRSPAQAQKLIITARVLLRYLSFRAMSVGSRSGNSAYSALASRYKPRI